jgi:adenylate cyclase
MTSKKRLQFAPSLHKFKDQISYQWLWILLVLILTLTISLTPFAISIEQKTGLQWLFQLRGPLPSPPDVVIVALNSTAAESLSLNRHSSTWSRGLLADLIRRLTLAQAKIVVMDIAFKEARTEQDDQSLEQAITQAQNVILFKYLKRHQLTTTDGVMDIEEVVEPISRFAAPALAAGAFVLPKYPANVSNAYIFMDISGKKEATQPMLGYLAQLPEKPQREIWQTLFPDLNFAEDLHTRAIHLYTAFQKNPPLGLFERLTSAAHFSHSFRIPNPLIINFYGKAETISTFPIDGVLRMEKDKLQQTFANKIVYIGYSDSKQTEQQDAYRSVYSNAKGVDISGVEISATTFANINHNQFIQPITWMTMSIINISVLLFALFMSPLTPRFHIIIEAVAMLAYCTIIYYLFSQHYIWLPILLPAISYGLGKSLYFYNQYHLHKKREKEIHYTLCQYLPSDAAHNLSRNFNRLEKQRQLVQGVCLLTDVQGYTRLAEQLFPNELHTLMNRYYAVLVDAVKNHDGFIGNLVGDGMLALWVGPEITPQMCQAAMQTVQEIQHRLAEDPELQENLPTFYGLHGGQFSLGNLGHQGHFEYSPVGDIINASARIEHLNRKTGTHLLCSKIIAEKIDVGLLQTPQKFQMRYLGEFQLRNKSSGIELYTLHPAKEFLFERFHQALQLYQQHNYSAALTLFNSLEEEYSDGPSAYYANLCQQEASKP